MFSIDNSNPAARAAMMLRPLLGGWCALVLLALCGCAASTVTVCCTGGPTSGNTGGGDTSGGATVVSRGLSLITEPGPGDRPFVALIDGARHSVEVTMYELNDPQVERALAAAAARGVHVAVLLDHGLYSEGRALNDGAYLYLSAHGVSVSWAPAYFALTHQKTILIDGRVAAIMTLNLTPADYASSRDFAVLDHRPADVSQVAQTFDADMRHRRIVPGAGSGDLLWSPGAQAPLDALIARARHSVDVESEEMDDPAVTRALCRAARRGVHVRILMTYQPALRAALTYLAVCGAQVRTYPANAALYIHAKLILVDRSTLFIGSQNFSRQSLLYNRELGIVTANPALAAAAEHTFDGDFAAAQP
jgi:cardiolipin synthase